MTFVRKRGLTRFAATAAATGLLAAGAIATAAPATADENPRNGGATATLEGLKIADLVDVEKDGKTHTYGAGLFVLNVEDGGTLHTYCIDFGTAAKNDSLYKETGWESTKLHGNPNAGKIHWILQNSYPAVDDLNALAEKVGAGSLTQKQAAAGTQAAIWGFSDGVDATPKNGNAKKLAEWLTKNAGTVEEPGASLELDPVQVSGKPGQKLGPVTVRTGSGSAVITPDPAAAESGVTVVDAEGQLVTESTPVADGAQLFFDVPEGAADGSASLTASVTSQVPVGRALTGIDVETQTMILAGSSDSSVSVNATASWASEGPSPAVTAKETCVEGGVEVTVTNDGDEPFTFTLAGEERQVAPGGSESIVVPVEEGQAYEITVTGPEDGEDWVFTGVLECETGGDGGKEEVTENDPTPDGGTEEEVEEDEGPNLAETGSSGSPMLIGGIALVLVLGGAGAVFMLRKKAAATAGE
ncbi:TQXA domain-containing protein [Streptomyces sodiiphilus]|uniref:TQXA domain-containing protein n=1 Tax=Streptomyces sodiiphilus TaxID=226217 RepID=A0ABN2NUF9_9ACTN